MLRIGFFLTPVFYLPEQFLSPAEQRLYLLNPVTQIMIHARQILLRHEVPSLAAMAGTLAFGVVLVAVGLANFRYFAPDLAEHI